MENRMVLSVGFLALLGAATYAQAQDMRTETGALAERQELAAALLDATERDVQTGKSAAIEELVCTARGATVPVEWPPAVALDSPRCTAQQVLITEGATPSWLELARQWLRMDAARVAPVE